MSEFTKALQELLMLRSDLESEINRPNASKEPPTELIARSGLQYRRDLPDFHAGLDLWEQRLSERDRAKVARDPDNLQKGQLVRLGSAWCKIWDLTADRYGLVTVIRGAYKDRAYPHVIKEAAKRAGELERLRQELAEKLPDAA